MLPQHVSNQTNFWIAPKTCSTHVQMYHAKKVFHLPIKAVVGIKGLDDNVNVDGLNVPVSWFDFVQHCCNVTLWHAVHMKNCAL